MHDDATVDSYLANGCGRCDKYRTPECKVHAWTAPLRALRKLLNASELVETIRWGSPTYRLDGKNVIMLGAFRDHCTISFLDGALLRDDDGLLEKPGPNTQSARVVKFTSAQDVKRCEAALADFVEQAIANRRAGKRPKTVRRPEATPAELRELLAADAELDAAWRQLTPGRQRSHILHIAGAKQAVTRRSRAEKCAIKIRRGKGFLDR